MHMTIQGTQRVPGYTGYVWVYMGIQGIHGVQGVQGIHGYTWVSRGIQGIQGDTV